MSAADRMVVRTLDGSYRSVPRRQGLGMIAAGRAQHAPASAASAPVYAVEPPEVRADEYQTQVDEFKARTRAALTKSFGPAVTPDDEPEDYDDWPDDPEPAAQLPAEPRGNASRAEWAEYAVSLGVEVTDDMSRNKIRDAAQDAAQSLDRLPQPALPGGRLETPEDEPAAERLADDEDPGTP